MNDELDYLDDTDGNYASWLCEFCGDPAYDCGCADGSNTMIQKLKETENYRSYLATDTGDVIMQGGPDALLIGMTTGETFFADGYYEVIVRGAKNSRYTPNSVSGHINHKRQIVRVLKGDADYDADESLSEADLDGIIRDYKSVDIRNHS